MAFKYESTITYKYPNLETKIKGKGDESEDKGDEGKDIEKETPIMAVGEIKEETRVDKEEYKEEKELKEKEIIVEMGVDSDFPPHINLFVHPNELKLEWSDAREPQAKFHSFVITEENGTKSYGIAATVFEKLSLAHTSDMNSLIQKWKEMSVKSEDLEYILHIQTQLLETQVKYDDLNKRLSLNPELLTEFRDMIDLLEENKNIYSKILDPVKKTLLVVPDQIYYPKSYCILSHYPFYDFFRDWLAQFLLVAQKSISSKETNTLFNHRGLHFSLECLIVNLTKEIPIPPPGKLEIAVSINETLLYLHRPPVNQIPIDKNVTFLNLLFIITLFYSF